MMGWIRSALAAILLMGWGSVAQVAQAQEPVRASCYAGTGLVPDLDHPRLPPVAQWNCHRGAHIGTPQVAWAFFTPDDFGIAETRPSHFVTDIGRFERISLIVMDAKGPLRARSYTMPDVSQFVNGPKFALPLPDMHGATGLVVAIEKPWSSALTAQARLQARKGGGETLGWSEDAMLSIALLLGLLATPIVYHTVFARILREGFVHWQIATMAALLGFVTVSSGLVHHVVSLGLGATIALKMAMLLATPFCAILFLLGYMETDALSEAMRKSLLGMATATLVICGFVTLPIDYLRPVAQPVVIAVQAMMVLTVAMACMAALRAGSHAVRIQIVFWSALLAAGLALSLQESGLAASSGWGGRMLYVAIAANVAVGSFAVIHRIDIMRRERERVNARLDALTNLIDLDALTGIFNRRAFEQRFAELRSDGFHALAVVDLDHFKRVNDRFGHTTGDRVLQEVAAVLASDKDAIAFRMGGEEFVVMLRGSQILQRAEQLRRAISIRVANEVDGIDSPVTASMGLIESPPGGASTMRQLYSQADRLLYEAKYSGRNRMISERIQVFETPSHERRARDRRNTQRRDAKDPVAAGR